jgi:hypothetical protein
MVTLGKQLAADCGELGAELIQKIIDNRGELSRTLCIG